MSAREAAKRKEGGRKCALEGRALEGLAEKGLSGHRPFHDFHLRFTPLGGGASRPSLGIARGGVSRLCLL